MCGLLRSSRLEPALFFVPEQGLSPDAVVLVLVYVDEEVRERKRRQGQTTEMGGS